MKRGIFLLAVFCLGMIMHAQQPLNPGDHCPDFEFTTILNSKMTKARLSDFKGKLLLLDFWSTNCGPCIAAFPKMESFQKQYGEKIMILPVIEVTKLNASSKEFVAKFWANNKITRTVSIPTLIIDTLSLISKSFPHQGVPHEVWIDGDGMIRGITSAAYVTNQNIEKLLNKEQVNWVVNRENMDFNASNTLLIPVDNGAGMPDKLFYTSLTSSLPTGKQNMLKIDSSGKYKKYLYMNMPLLMGYKMMLNTTNRRDFLWNNRIVLEVKDKSAYIFDRKLLPYEEWIRKNAYCYEAVLPETSTTNDFFSNIGFDLNRFLNLNGRIEKRIMPCLVLKRTSTDDNLFQSSKKEEAPQMDQYHNLSEKEMVSFITSFSDFLVSVNRLEENPILLDETGYTGSVHIPLVLTTADGKSLIKSMTDIDGIRKQLSQFGLDIVTENREVEVFVITENNFKN